MKNFIFISPNFPTNYWMFCRELKMNGLNVLGIGDQPYDELDYNVKENLNEYYKVSTLENYEEVYRAVAFLIFKYGRIDWLESNNEYWLERDARLRTEFHITSGFQESDIPRIKFKSKMKDYYKKAGIPTAHFHMVDTEENCLAFAKEVGYPVVAKPDNGVGASHTFKNTSDEEMKTFFEDKWPDTVYIMEEYIWGEVNSYDAIIDSNGKPMFETGNVSPVSIMDIVNEQQSSLFYILNNLPSETRKAGRATVKAFGVKSRFVHFEFFRLQRDQEGLGKAGDLVALEVNMRPSGGFTPDMINFAHSTDVNKTTMPAGASAYCAFVGRRDGKDYVLDDAALSGKYSKQICMEDRMPDALSGAMGNRMYIATFSTEKQMAAFYKDALTCR